MIVAIDYDGTITADLDFFRQMIPLLKSRGHTVLIVTNRGPETIIAWQGVETIYCNGRPKRAVCLEHGFRVDVWVDDNPILVDYGAAGLAMIGYCHN